MQLIDGWKAAWRYHVVIAAAALAALNWGVAHSDVVAQFVDTDQMAMLNKWVPLLIIILRVVRQPAATAAVQAAAAKDTAPAAPADPPKELS